MSRWKNILSTLTEPRLGAAADGRGIGVGLSAALAEQRKDAEAVAAVAKTLRKDAEGDRVQS